MVGAGLAGRGAGTFGGEYFRRLDGLPDPVDASLVRGRGRNVVVPAWQALLSSPRDLP
jgi:hypothetical protein